MTDETFVLRYFPSYIGSDGFGREGRKGIGSVTLEKLEQVAKILEREGIYNSREELNEVIRYTFRKGGEVRDNEEVFTLTEDVYVEVGKMNCIPYGSVEKNTGHVEAGIREARVIRSLESLSELSLYNLAIFRLNLPVDPLETEKN